MKDMQKDGTEKIYYEDAYADSFTGRVISCTKKNIPESDETFYDLVLDRTAFFPEEGGQSPDTGILGGHAVADVQIHGGVIVHTLKENDSESADSAKKAGCPKDELCKLPFAEGLEVSGRIDFGHRFSNMQQHSGEHLFSGIVHSTFGYDNVGFHLSDREVTLDLNGILTSEDIRMVEHKVNEAICSDIATVISYPTKEEEKDIDYRSKIEIEGQTRLVSFPGYDVCACCAPHVKRTGEIGLLKVVNAVNYKGGMRVSILCGSRALELFDFDHSTVTTCANYLTTSADKIYESLQRFKDENTALKAELKKAAKERLMQMLSSMPADSEDVVLFVNDADTQAVRDAVNVLAGTHGGICTIFNGDDESGYSYIAGSKNGDSRIVGNLLKEKLSARGGGKPEMIQGSVKASEDEIRKALS